MNINLNNERIGLGLPLLGPDGTWIKEKLISYLRKKLVLLNYQEVESPAVGTVELFSISGHYPYYKESMFPVIKEDKESNNLNSYLLKPMNCPFHIEIYRSSPKSYRDLPIKYFEFGKVYRLEDSGAVNNLLRARAFQQDDGHCFVSIEQIENEVGEMVKLAIEIFQDFGLEFKIGLSVREKDKKDKYIGDDKIWEKAEKMLFDALFKEVGDKMLQVEGGAAFYGPTIDFFVKDKLEREWQLGTIQLDFNLPERFKLKFKNKDNQEEQPVLIHRAFLGSLERFMAILLENNAVPDFCYPRLYAVAPVLSNQESLNYCKEISKKLFVKEKSNKIFFLEKPLKAKIKRAKKEGYRHVLVIGKNEIEAAKLQNKLLANLNSKIIDVELI